MKRLSNLFNLVALMSAMLLAPSIFAQSDSNVKNAYQFKKGHRYMDGLLVELTSGKKKLIVADVLVSHVTLNYSLNYEKDGSPAKDPLVKILWAGEMEVDADGNVVKVNEIAGIIRTGV